ncbi:Metallo-dependent phosphatase [Pluteus cervinus]|uniref:Metallo-dependent phosphatase n=1 Tax=Pluteus cervinus TaxID=181527 RepID=A0ACD3B164_9AGAR|nr:Metallo-dependent phosphatase [Pluteus cervinus]
MALFSCWRFFRALRSMCAPITTGIGFSFLLTWIFILYQPSSGPGLVQRVGWQSWDSISLPPEGGSSASGGASTNPSTPGGGNTDVEVPSGVDWWNVTNSQDNSFDSTSLPLDVWNPVLPHDTGLSEISLARCLVNPDMILGDPCAPDTTPEQDAIKGKWVRIPRDLNLEGGYLSGWLYLYYRRTRRQDINLITDLRLLPEKESPEPISDWKKVDMSLRSGILGSPPLFLWYKTGKTAGDMTPEEKANIITELDLLYGEDDPWYGFEKMTPATMPEHGKVQATWLTFRRGVKVPPRAPPLHFSHSGKFKILQVADLHFSVSQGRCRDTDLIPCKNSDNLTTTLVRQILEAEKPDLVIFTGDQLNGQGTTWDARSVLAKFAKSVIKAKIPWAAVFGNHDDEDGYTRDTQLQWLKNLPYSLVERGPKDLHGVGNYVLKVLSADASKTQLLTLYFLDSGSYSKGFLDWFGMFTPTAYDYIRQDQIDWFLQESARIKPIERPFTPDTGKDLGGIWNKRQGPDQLPPDLNRLAKPNAMMFFHMPLQEAYNDADRDPRTGKPLDVGLSGLETPGNAKENEGMFEKGLLKAEENDHVGRGRAPEVKVVGNGHCHLTENCRRVKGVWMCFGGGGSYSGYGKLGFDRRFRVYEISDFGETIKTWKRTERDEVIDEMILTGPGSAPLER